MDWEQEIIIETDVSGLAPCPFSHAHIQCETSLSLHAYRGFDVECVGVVEYTCGARMRASEFIARSVEDEEADPDLHGPDGLPAPRVPEIPQLTWSTCSLYSSGFFL